MARMTIHLCFHFSGKEIDMTAEYPNLPLIEERFANAIQKDITEKKEQEKAAGNKWYRPAFEAQVFLQTFPNTAGIFENGGISGNAITPMYITVIEELTTGIIGVFGGNTAAYLVTDANDLFCEDVKNRTVKTRKEAAEVY